jgi:hypothetical protein
LRGTNLRPRENLRRKNTKRSGEIAALGSVTRALTDVTD